MNPPTAERPTPTRSLEEGTPAPVGAATLGTRYRAVRAATEDLCTPLETEDFVVQSMPEIGRAHV